MQHYEAIRELLRRVRARWRTVRLFEAVTRAALAASVVLGVALLVARFAPRAPMIFGLLGALGTILVAAAILWGLTPVRRVPSDTEVARFIEERAASLDDRLASAVDVVVSKTTSRSPALVEPMLADAARRARDVDINEIVPAGFLRRRMAQASAAALVLALAALGARGLVRETLDAMSLTLFPLRVELEVAPGDARVMAGAPLAIRARLVGSRAPVVAQVRIGKGDDSRTTDMAAEGDGQFRLALESLTSSFSYRVTAGSASSPDYTVTVVRPPRVTRIDVDYAYPPALGLKPRTEEDGGDIYAPAGTDVRMRIHTDRPVRSGHIALAEGQAIALTASAGTELTGTLKLVSDDSYRVALTDPYGLVNPGDTEYFIRALEDSPPQVRIRTPAADRNVMPLEEVDIEAQANDDFGIARLELVYGVGGRDETVVSLARDSRGETAEGRHTLFLEDLNVQPGDLISYYVRAFDVGRGRQSNEARSDIFFLEVKPFDQEFVLAQSQAGSGSSVIDDLIAAQKEVVVATWKLDRRAGGDKGSRSEHDIRAVARAETDLKSRVEGTASAFRENSMRNPRQPPRRGRGGDEAVRAGQTLSEEDAMAAASAAMGKAITALTALKTREALPPEMEALTYLMKAQGDVKRREVSRQQGGAGRDNNNRNFDLSALFDRELQRSQETNYENRGTTEQRDDRNAGLLERIKELARRQDELLKRQRDLARDRDKLTGDELRRELEKLMREQSELRQQAEELAQQQGTGGGAGRGMRDVSEQMRSATGDLRRQNPGGASASGSRALDRLHDLERQLQASSPDERRRALGDMQLEARQLADAERRIANELGAASQGEGGKDAARRLAGQQEALANRARKLQEALKPMAGAPGKAGRDLERQQVVERLQKSAEDMRASAGRQGTSVDPRQSADAERLAARELDKLADTLASANGSGDGEARKLSEQLARAREIRKRLENMGREAARLGWQNGEEYARRLQQARDLINELKALDPGGQSGIGGTPEGQGSVVSAAGTEAFKQDFAQWERLRLQATSALEKAESALSQKLQAKQSRDRLAAGVNEKALPEYQQQVDSYFKAIAGGKK